MLHTVLYEGKVIDCDVSGVRGMERGGNRVFMMNIQFLSNVAW